jgi:exopolysaccharide biosynthesis polyprenyl glycosylphosphotransferase
MNERAQFARARESLAAKAGVGRMPGSSVDPGTHFPFPDFSSSDAPIWTKRRKSNRHGSDSVWLQAAFALIDAAFVVLDSAVAFLVRFARGGLHGFLFSGHARLTTDQPISRYLAFLLLYVVLILIFCKWYDLYRTSTIRRFRDESSAIFEAVFLATLLLAAFVFLSGIKIVSRFVVAAAFCLNVLALAAWRYARRRIVTRRVEAGIAARNVVIIGAGAVGRALARVLDNNKLLGYKVKGFLDGKHLQEARVLGRISDLVRVARAEFVDDVFITIPSERELVKRIALEARTHHLTVKIVPDFYDGLAWNSPIQHIGDFPVIDLCWQPIPTFCVFLKRVTDLTLSSVALIVFSPVLLALAAWVKLDSPGPVFYRSARVGKKGRIFTCHKLRTMVQDADRLKDSLRDRNEREGPFFKIAEDPRITRAGKFLRKYSLDELPQLWNVLKGDMSLVGPRPHPIDDYAKYNLEHLRRLDVKPGITGLWQITARQDPSFETNLRLDLEYIDRWNLLLDFKILFKTAAVACSGTGQ